MNNPNLAAVSTELADMHMSTPEEDLQFLKTCVIKNVDEHEIIRKLKSTQTLRHQMMQDQNVDIRTSFPFFFASPQLVRFLTFIYIFGNT